MKKETLKSKDTFSAFLSGESGEKVLSQTLLVCIAKNHGFKVRINGERTFCTIPWYNTFTLEHWEEETEITNYTRSQLMNYLGY